MKSYFFLFVIVFYGCENQNDEPKLSPDYLQPIFLKIRQTDSSAEILNFLSKGEKFEFLDKIIEAGSFDIKGPLLKGEVRSYTEIDYDISQKSIFDSLPGKLYSTTYFVYSGNKILEKRFKDSSKNRVSQVKYFNNYPDTVTTIYKEHNDSLKTKLTYENSRLVATKLYSNKGVLIIKENLIYEKNGNLDYQYIINRDTKNEFEKNEFNNELRQFILARFDKNKRLLWIKYSEFDSRGNIVYQERFKEENINHSFEKDRYVFDDNDELIHSESFWPKRNMRMIFDFQYSKKDSLGNWVERVSLVNNEPNFITKRKINYKLVNSK